MAKKSKHVIIRPILYVLLAITLLLLAGVLMWVYYFAPERVDDHQEVQTTSQVETKGYDAYANIDENDIEPLGLLWEVAVYPERIPIVALVRINSIDGGRNYSPIHERYVVSETYGKMTVLEVYKGDVQLNQELAYSRVGGIITAQEYLKAITAPGSEETYLHARKPAEKKYVKEYIVDDIDVEVGKNYLAFLTPEASKDGRYQEYKITGVQVGLREVRGSGTAATVLNNGTGKWESLSSVVKLY